MTNVDTRDSNLQTRRRPVASFAQSGTPPWLNERTPTRRSHWQKIMPESSIAAQILIARNVHRRQISLCLCKYSPDSKKVGGGPFACCLLLLLVACLLACSPVNERAAVGALWATPCAPVTPCGSIEQQQRRESVGVPAMFWRFAIRHFLMSRAAMIFTQGSRRE